MIKINVGGNTLKNVSSIFVKTGENVKKEAVEIYQVYDNAGVNALKTVYSSVLKPPIIINVYNDDRYVYVECKPASTNDTVEMRFVEYAANGTLTYDGTWRSMEDYSEGFEAYGCTEYVHIYARSVRNGEYSEVTVYEYYIGASDHTPRYENNAADYMHYIYCDVCGEYLGEGLCNDHDDNGDFVCDLCGGWVSV